MNGGTQAAGNNNMGETMRPQRKERFQAGQIFVTPGALAATTSEQRETFLSAHLRGDWGAVGAEQWQLNDRGFDTSQWLASLSSQVDMRAPLNWLSDRLLEAGRKHIGISERLTFSVAGFEGERPFVTIVSNFQSFDANRLSVIPTSRRKWEATTHVGRHGAFATGSAEYVYLDELNALPKFARTHPTIEVHQKLAELNRTAAQRAGANGQISESCFTGQMSLDGSGGLVPHDVNPGGEYLPKFATDLLTGMRVIPRTDGDGNPLPRRLVQMGIKRRNTPFETAFIYAELQAIVEKVPAETDAERHTSE